MGSLTDIPHGEVIFVRGREHLFDTYTPAASGRAIDHDDLQFMDRRTHRALIISEREFLSLYAAGEITWPDSLAKPGDREAEDGAPDSIIRRIRRYWLETFDKCPVPKSNQPLIDFIQANAKDQPGPPGGWVPGHETLRRWTRERGEPGKRKLKYMGDRHRKGPRGSHRDPIVQEAFDGAVKRFNENRSVTKKDVYVLMRADLAATNEERRAEELEPVRIPSLSTVCRWVDRGLTYEVARNRDGRRAADRAFKPIKGSLEVKRVLDVVIIDDTRVDCWVVDERGIPISRPWITLAIDAYSRMPLGFHLSFDWPSVLTAMACLRMVVRPKLDIRTRFPGISADWEAFGLPRTVYADNAWQNGGSSFEDACSDAGMSVQWTPVEQPWFKGIIERFVLTLNNQLFHKLPGGVPVKPHLLKEFGLDPQRHAVLSLRQLHEFLYRYWVEIYPNQPHQGLDGAKPLNVWRDRVPVDHIDLVHDPESLNQALSTMVNNRTLSREGVTFKGLTYRSEEVSSLLSDLIPLQATRRRFGAVKVKIKYHAEDLSKIFVWNEVKGIYVTLPCTKQDYAVGLSENLHDQIVKAKKAENIAFMSEDDLCILKAKLLRMMWDEMPSDSIKGRRQKARTMNNQAPPQHAHSQEGEIITNGVSGRHGGDRPEKAVVRNRRRKARSSTTESPPQPPALPQQAPSQLASRDLFDDDTDWHDLFQEGRKQ